MWNAFHHRKRSVMITAGEPQNGQANKPDAGERRLALSDCSREFMVFVSRWPGVPDPGRSAASHGIMSTYSGAGAVTATVFIGFGGIPPLRSIKTVFM